MVIFDMMSVKVEKLLLELSEEVFRVCPKTKKNLEKWFQDIALEMERIRWLF